MGTPAPPGLFAGPNPFAAFKPLATGPDGGPGLATGLGGLPNQLLPADKDGAEEEGLFDELMQGNTALSELNNM
jgi:hypothetical protein